jgi:hypothetical protein
MRAADGVNGGHDDVGELGVGWNGKVWRPIQPVSPYHLKQRLNNINISSADQIFPSNTDPIPQK